MLFNPARKWVVLPTLKEQRRVSLDETIHLLESALVGYKGIYGPDGSAAHLNYLEHLHSDLQNLGLEDLPRDILLPVEVIYSSWIEYLKNLEAINESRNQS